MKSDAKFKRPSLTEALKDWNQLLAERGYSTELTWVFAENLCVEKAPSAAEHFHFGFQTRFTPPAEDALDIAFDHFAETGAPIVFYRLGGRAGKSVCMLLCDPWFESKREADGFVRRDEWRMLFYPGRKEEI